MIKIGNMIVLEHKYSESYEQYKCKLVEQRGNDLYIDYPVNTSTNRTVFLLEGTPLKATFTTESGINYFFETEVKGRVKLNIPMVILSYPGKDHLIKVQRRQFVRVETSVDVAVHSAKGEFVPFTTVTDDISAGGAALLIDKSSSLKQGMELDCWLALPMQNGENEYRKFRGTIVRIIEGQGHMNKASVQFYDSSGTDRQLLLRFCFERQLAMKKKGLPV
ncbi:flagellar brake protein [Mesobacillus subterraneus]|uniref:Pilus assembly protein PilZ n=1 Tax=Mesobacillus subterraneus TaxID=285983 RepID=A0A3R9DSP0_9BACI|nr:flagellar brake domain-containing protein [Mesobacillus subterraneus]RSD26479.1 pilus assembly protein PilZ [Mesobacillus subterraneus]